MFRGSGIFRRKVSIGFPYWGADIDARICYLVARKILRELINEEVVVRWDDYWWQNFSCGNSRSEAYKLNKLEIKREEHG